MGEKTPDFSYKLNAICQELGMDITRKVTHRPKLPQNRAVEVVLISGTLMSIVHGEKRGSCGTGSITTVFD